MSKDFSSLLGGAIANKKLDESNIRRRITIREDFKTLIPSLSTDELEQLEANIIKEGVRDPLIIWQVGESFVLVDGHNRFSLCQKHGLDFPFKQVEFKDDDDARDWMIKNQLGRRNLSPEQQSYLRGLRYNREKSQGKRTDLTLDQSDLKSQTMSTAAVLAKEYNVSEATIKRDGEFAEGIENIGKKNSQLKDEILKGKSKLSKKEIQSLGKKSSKSSPVKPTESKKLSSNKVARIAYEYILSETRTIEEVGDSLDLQNPESNPEEFFRLWDQKQNQK
jgi:hypothetical protein